MDQFPAQVPAAYGAPSMLGPGGEPPKRAHLYVGNLSPRVTEYMLQEIFAVAGPVLGVKIIPDRNFQHGGANYGFVEYHEMQSAETALQTLSGRRIFDMEIKCNWAYQNTNQTKEDLTNHFHLFVGDLSPEVNDQVLTKAFQVFGSLSDCRVMWDMNTGKSRGYGFLAFRDRTDAEQAIAAMNGEYLGSRAIRCNWANQKNNGAAPEAGGSRGGMSGGMSGGQGGPGGSYESVVSQASAFNTTIYVGNLVPFVTQADLIPLFQGFGYIVEIRMQPDRGFAFIKLDSHDNAANAIVNLQGTMVHGRGLKCSWGKSREDGGGNSNFTPAAPGGFGQYGGAPQQQQPAYPAPVPVPQGQLPPGGDPGAAMAAWQAQYGAQWAAYQQQQQSMGAPPA
ncbi:uncharacterized protein JCM6883_006751 [Sporobolomyces salmoneus]|uniref:uncharacterized protein n=1 Tax=Sporobolomyces salmoneus TaxID=183962 RepID=UPI003171B5EB